MGAKDAGDGNVPGREREHQPALPLVDLADAALTGMGPEQGDLQQVHSLLGHIPVPVQHLIHHIVVIVPAADEGDAPVKIHPLAGIGHIVLGQRGANQ